MPQLRREDVGMICFYIMAILSRLAGAGALEALRASDGADLSAIALWVLCDIEALKLIFGKRR